MIGTTVVTRNFGNVGCIPALVGIFNLWAGGICNSGRQHMIVFYTISVIVAIPLGIVCQSVMLWYIDWCLSPEQQGASSTGEDPCSLGPLQDNITMIVWLSIFFDSAVRAAGVYMAVTSYQEVSKWQIRMAAERRDAAIKVQAAARGITTRNKLRRQKGVVTRAIAGKHFKALYYQPDSPLEIKAQQYLRLWSQKRVPQTVHQIRSQASQTHSCVIAMQECFKKFDDDASGTIDLKEAGRMFVALGAEINPISIEFLMAESFAPPAEKASAAKIKEMQQRSKEAQDRLTNKAEKDADAASRLADIVGKAKESAEEEKEKEAVPEGKYAKANKDPEIDTCDTADSFATDLVTLQLCSNKRWPICRSDWPEVGAIVRLRPEAVSKNLNDIVNKACLGIEQGEDTGKVVDLDPTSLRYSIEVEANGKRSWYMVRGIWPALACLALHCYRHRFSFCFR
eukprot:SAG31_NODE_1099_length_9914_cov_6.721345_2_plen_454_part_00